MSLGRKTAAGDKFYTRPDIAKACLAVIKEDLREADCAIEPSAGAGAFLLPVSGGGPGRNVRIDVIAMDTEPECPGLGRCDYIKDFDMAPESFDHVVVVGNPPFGVNHALSDAFLVKSFAFPDVKVVAFVLPNTYNKPRRQKVIPEAWRIRSIMPLGKNAFVTPAGEPFHVPCSFFVFDRKTDLHDLRTPATCDLTGLGFEFAPRGACDFFVFGTNPANMTDTPAANHRGYGIRATGSNSINDVRRLFRSVNWQARANSCASGGVAWFSKPEIAAGIRAIMNAS